MVKSKSSNDNIIFGIIVVLVIIAFFYFKKMYRESYTEDCMNLQTKKESCPKGDSQNCCYSIISETSGCDKYDENGNCINRQLPYCLRNPSDPLCAIKTCNDPASRLYVNDISGCVSYHAPEIFESIKRGDYPKTIIPSFQSALLNGKRGGCVVNSKAIDCVLSKLEKL
jgi:hypothetical protein